MEKPLFIAERVTFLREKRGLNKSELARQIASLRGEKSFNVQNIQNLERGEVKRPFYLIELARVLDTTPEWLLGIDGADDPPPHAETVTVAEHKLLKRHLVRQSIVSFMTSIQAAGIALSPAQFADAVLRYYDEAHRGIAPGEDEPLN